MVAAVHCGIIPTHNGGKTFAVHCGYSPECLIVCPKVSCKQRTAGAGGSWKLEVSCLTIGDSEKETFGDTRTMALSAGQCRAKRRAANYPNFLNGIQRQLVTV